MGRGAGPHLAAVVRRGAARRRTPEGPPGAHPALLRPGDTSLRAARSAHAGRSPWQFTARADHGAGEAFARRHSGARIGDRRSHHLLAERGRHRGLEARSGVSADVEIVSLAPPVAETALVELADVLVDCVEGGASVSFMSPFSPDSALGFF